MLCGIALVVIVVFVTVRQQEESHNAPTRQNDLDTARQNKGGGHQLAELTEQVDMWDGRRMNMVCCDVGKKALGEGVCLNLERRSS